MNGTGISGYYGPSRHKFNEVSRCKSVQVCFRRSWQSEPSNFSAKRAVLMRGSSTISRCGSMCHFRQSQETTLSASACACACLRMFACVSASVCVSVCVSLCVCVCVCVFVCVFGSLCCVCLCVCVCVCVYVTVCDCMYFFCVCVSTAVSKDKDWY